MADNVVEISGGSPIQSASISSEVATTSVEGHQLVGSAGGLDQLDEESPLHVSGHKPVEDGVLKPDTVPLFLPEPAHQGGGAQPLIILPVQSEGVPSSGGLPIARSNLASPAPPPQGEELKQVLLQQLEYYFSKDNLSSDKYLLSQMDGDNYVPVSVISNFNQVKRLTVDMSLILEVLRESTVLQLDESDEKVRAIPEKRCVLILREIPKDTPKEELVALFSHETCPSCETCEFADNNCWYVTFDSEESTQKAFAHLREKVKVFLGQPIRARIKGTTVQRSSGMPKAKHGPFVPPVFNGAPPQIPFYPPPPSGVPWSPTPPTSSTSPYFEPSNFSHFMGNGFTPPQQGPPSQAGATGQSPAATAAATATAGGGIQPFNGGRYPASGGFPYRGPPSRAHWGDRGQSPPSAATDTDTPVASEREKAEYKSGRSLREGGLGGGGGVAGAKYAGRHNSDDRKIPRLKNTRHGGRMGEADRGVGPEKTQLPPPRKAQPKLDLATFPPLPNSSSAENGTAPTSAPPTTSHSHASTEDGPKTLSDIVRGGSRIGGKEAGIGATSSASSAVASTVVEKSIASATAKLSQAQSPTVSSCQDSAPQSQHNVNSDPATPTSRPDLQAATITSASAGGGASVTVVTTSRPLTASSVVASGGGASQQGTLSNHIGNRAAGAPTSARKHDPKISGKDKVYNNGNNKAHKYSDREVSSGKQNRNPQVVKTEPRSAQPSNRNRHKDRDPPPSSSSSSSSSSSRPSNTSSSIRPNNGTRQNNAKSPKSFKKNFPQAPPPPPGPLTDSAPSDGVDGNQISSAGTKNENTSSTSSHSQSATSAKPEKLSYAQMAQKKRDSEGGGGGGGAKATSPPTSPPETVATTTTPSTQSTTKSIKSTSTGSLATGQGQSSKTIVSRSAPTSPTKESGPTTSGSGQFKSKESEV